ncbi:LysR family transcriptional regulator [Rhodalgimonas zhirmunskyi]|uniref:LysR family transcriptional regulator n=1 Tax=Rhodalgimonas zhirmunskyi TaxID=2964767 RepID=A0AAJ1UCM3_9RHOB|nr:LysR family transcriptional regulator [Rhodoalgimonas zhirmunskyi]MDQ2095488.1 LysR family transcriptional regulator [Rhodoalgimonas zhirmunskyi]
MVTSTGKITLWGIEVFVATAEERSISAAARRLGASPSAVSQQLTNLEAALGASLLVRNERPVRLTPAGEILRRRASIILDEAAQAQAELAMRDMSALTRFRLGVIEDFEADVTPRLLTRMAEELDRCQFLLETGASHTLYGQLDARALDMIIAAEVGLAEPWMEVHPLLEDGFAAVVPRGAVEPSGDVAAQLMALPLVQYSTRHWMGRLIAGHLAQHGMRPGHQFEIDSYHAILAMVAQGTGWTVLSPLALMRAHRFAEQIDVVTLPVPPLKRRIALIARAGMLQDLPAQVVETLKPILRDTVINPAIEEWPELGDALRLL